MNTAIEQLTEELSLIERHIKLLDNSVLHRGLLIIPEELETSWEYEDSPTFHSELAEALMSPLPEGHEASNFMGVIVRGPVEALREIRHIDFSGDKEFRQVLCARAYDLKNRIKWVEDNEL